MADLFFRNSLFSRKLPVIVFSAGDVRAAPLDTNENVQHISQLDVGNRNRSSRMANEYLSG